MPNWAAGDLCLIFVVTDGAANYLSAHFAVAGGDQALTSLAGSPETDTPTDYVFYRWCTGVELDVDLHIVGTNSEPYYVVAMQITGVDHDFALIAPNAVIATTANPDPPAIAALKETRDVLYIVTAAHDHNDTWSSDPSGYATVQNGNSGTGSGDCGGAVAYLAVTGSAAVDPGTFGWSGSEESVARTIAILGNLSPVVAEHNPVAVPTTPIALGKADSTCNAQVFSFTPRESCNIEKIACYMAKVSSPTDDVTFSIRTTYNGANAATTAAVDVQAAAWYEGTIASPYAVTAGTTYWIAVARTGSLDSTNYYNIYYGPTANNPLQTSYTNTTGTTYVENNTWLYNFQARKTTAVEWVPVDPMGASGFFGV